MRPDLSLSCFIHVLEDLIITTTYDTTRLLLLVQWILVFLPQNLEPTVVVRHWLGWQGRDLLGDLAVAVAKWIESRGTEGTNMPPRGKVL